MIPQYLDPDCYSVVCGGIATTTTLLAQRWDKIFFTGSPRVGKVVMQVQHQRSLSLHACVLTSSKLVLFSCPSFQSAAVHLTPVSLELGGKSPVIVDESVTDMTLAARRLAWGKCANAGQTCIAPDYVLCHEKVYDKFLKETIKFLIKSYGDEADQQQSSHYSRIISTQHCQRLQGLLEDGKKSGKIVFGGKIDVESRFVQPTLIVDVELNSRLV